MTPLPLNCVVRINGVSLIGEDIKLNLALGVLESKGD